MSKLLVVGLLAALLSSQPFAIAQSVVQNPDSQNNKLRYQQLKSKMRAGSADPQICEVANKSHPGILHVFQGYEVSQGNSTRPTEVFGTVVRAAATRDQDGNVSWNAMQSLYPFETAGEHELVRRISIDTAIPAPAATARWRSDVEAHHRFSTSLLSNDGEVRKTSNSYGSLVEFEPSDCGCTLGRCVFTERKSIDSRLHERRLVSDQKVEGGFWKTRVHLETTGSNKKPGRLVFEMIRSFDNEGRPLDSAYEEGQYKLLLFRTEDKISPLN